MNVIQNAFSGMAEFKMTTTDFENGTESVAVYIKDYSDDELHGENSPAVLLDLNPHEYWIYGCRCSNDESGHFLARK